MKKDFQIEDIIVVIGATIAADKGGNFSQQGVNRVLCEVLAVGQYDLFVKKIKDSDYSYTSSYPFRVSKAKCVSIDERVKNSLAEIIKPKLGDLVLSYATSSATSKKDKFKIGFLVEISDIPGSSKTCKILAGEKIVHVPYDSLIIFEKTKQ